MDAGAYTGLSTVFFANRFPDKKIIAIEPDKENYAMLIKNTHKYKNVKAYHAAVWNRNTTVVIINKESSLWGFQVEETEETISERSKRFHDRIASEGWSEIALVTHWGFIRALTGLTVPNGAVLRIDPTRPDREAEMVFVPDLD